MTGVEDGPARDPERFLARWSRRKRGGVDARPADDGEQAQNPQPPEPGGDGRKPGEPPPLPPVDTLTPESDFSVFLHPGVSSGLRTEALRRLWSLDPAIRDFVGPADYAWDFNRPGAVPGFGPAQAITRLAGALAAPRDAERGTAPDPSRGADPPGVAEDGRPRMEPGDERQAARPDAVPEAAAGGGPAPGSSPGPKPLLAPIRRHGGAKPRFSS